MTVETFPPPERREPDRDRWKRPLVIPPDGGKAVAYTRCTTFVDCLDDKWMLQKWQQRMVALGLTQRRDLALAYAAIAGDLQLPEVPKSAKSKADEICEAAIEAAEGSAKASIGTALHTFTERLDLGLSVDHVPDEYRADVAAYEHATRPLTALHIEQFTVHDGLQIGGTPDRVVTYDGRNYIADLKTGSVAWGALKIAMQLAVYAHSELYDVPTGARSPLPDVDQDRAIVIHLPAGTGKCELQWVNIAAGWEAVQVAADVRKWRKRGRSLLSALVPEQQLALDVAPAQPDAQLEPAPEPVDDQVATLRNRIASAPNDAALRHLWSDYREVWTPELTALASARKRLLAEAG